MIADVITVATKELREIFTFGDVRGRSKFSLLILVLIFGIVIPLQNGRDWVTSPISIMVWGWMPFLWVSGIVADLFAGERERHTLESLLATRLSDRSILFGKLFAALTYGFSLTWLIMLASLITVNIGFGSEGLLFYPMEMFFGAIVFSILISGLSACIGVLVSLRAGSVRQAQQMMSAGMLVLFLPFMLIQFIPKSWLEAAGNLLDNIQPVQVAVWLAVILLVVELILIAIARRMFQRSKLILD
ncbi:MAG: ABC-2 type transporter [Anaerolineales bacterium]|nr:ABC transporter permease [Anaerolineae bacterium]PWB74863.1 MAG: ABC-2 type transporter [Anaerolineales bacterium]